MIKKLTGSLKKIILENKIVTVIIFLYFVSIVSIIGWGTPNLSHPFPYHMDEWHQMQSVRFLFTKGTPNIAGAAHGPILQFFIGGILLLPFIFTGFVNPFVLKSPIVNLEMQQRLFEALRVNTLFFGILTIIFLTVIAMKYFKLNPVVTVVLFTISPVWLALSNYFKYDIALNFWIVFSMFFFLRYSEKPTFRNFLILGFVSAIPLAVKLSSMPMPLIYIFSFFLFTPEFKRKIHFLFFGLIIFFITLILIGFPDIFSQWKEYQLYFSSQVNLEPDALSGVNSLWKYLIFSDFPVIFGRFIYPLFILSVIFNFLFLGFKFLKHKLLSYKKELFIFSSFLIFSLSLIPLKSGATGNRVLVLLPFFALFSGIFLKIATKSNKKIRQLISIVIILLIIVQILESSVFITAKWARDSREESSAWIIKNVKQGTTIGIENIPLYQSLPDLVLKEFYLQENHLQTTYKYKVISSLDKDLPKVVIVTNKDYEISYKRNPLKKQLVNNLGEKGYYQKASFSPNKGYYRIFGNDLNIFESGILAVSNISIYAKR